MCVDFASGAVGFEEVLYSLDKSASVASLLDAVEQKLGSAFDPAFASMPRAEADVEKQAEKMRNELKEDGLEERLIEVCSLACHHSCETWCVKDLIHCCTIF